eukprot:702290-Prymnesium_polylepis.1
MRRELARNLRESVPNASRTFANPSRIRANRVENFRESVANLVRIFAQNHCELGANARRCGFASPVAVGRT